MTSSLNAMSTSRVKDGREDRREACDGRRQNCSKLCSKQGLDSRWNALGDPNPRRAYPLAQRSWRSQQCAGPTK